MKQLVITLLSLSMMISCKKEEKMEQTQTPEVMAAVSPEMMENAVIYEANIRQYSPEGTFNAFTKDIPQLKELGIKVIWVMPIFPISETKRKATGDKFAHEIEDENERKKYLGSYYAVTDFTKVNPEFGTIEDFRKLVKTAHDNGMYVILDWVPNHTGWDHVWIKQNPDYYTKNAKGEVTEPLNPDGTPVGWADVADLNYSNQDMRKEMIEDMSYWLKEESIDGFRCDVAGSVPLDFWQQAIPQLRSIKPIFMLAEAWEPELLKDNLFDMCYAWDGHHLINHIAQGKKNVNDWDNYINSLNTKYEADDILMNFVDNHDENSWNGTIPSRLGNAAEVFTALTYVMPGMPLVYSGNEYGLSHSLKFFEKDQIPKEKGEDWELRKKLGNLKNNFVAINGGKNKASYKKISTENNERMLAFEREKEGKKIIFVGNLSAQTTKIKLPFSGNFTNYITNQKENIATDTEKDFAPWEYMILVVE